MSHQQTKSGIFTIIGAILVVISILTPHLLDSKLWQRTKIRFEQDSDTLLGTYYPGDIDAGIILLEGFGSDQVTLRSAVSAFRQAGFHIFTFDFSGHGRSPGTLSYNNAENPRLAYQVMGAMKEFKTLSGLDRDQILLLGHSLGARVALEAAVRGADPVGLILLGTQVNLNTNTQAEFFTGVSDSDLAWVQSLAADNPAAHVLLISGQWDDILTPESAALLLEKLGGLQTANSSPGGSDEEFQRELVILPSLLHNYEIFSPRALRYTLAWAGDILDPPLTARPNNTNLVRIWCWVIGFVGLYISLINAAAWRKSDGEHDQPPDLHIQITSLNRFLWAKLLLWLAALPLGAVIAGLFFFLPAGLPTFNLIYVAFFGGYGILMLLLYRFGRLPGTAGKLPFTKEKHPGKKGGWIYAAGITILLLVVTAAYARTGWFYVFPLNMRLLWLLLFSIPTALGFWIGIHEISMISQAAPSRNKPQVLALLIGILPFFIYTLFLAILGSLSGVIGGLQGLLILGMVMALGYLLRQINQIHWVTAFCQAVLLYWLILPQGVLFG